MIVLDDFLEVEEDEDVGLLTEDENECLLSEEQESFEEMFSKPIKNVAAPNS